MKVVWHSGSRSLFLVMLVLFFHVMNDTGWKFNNGESDLCSFTFLSTMSPLIGTQFFLNKPIQWLYYCFSWRNAGHEPGLGRGRPILLWWEKNCILSCRWCLHVLFWSFVSSSKIYDESLSENLQLRYHNICCHNLNQEPLVSLLDW